MKNIIKVLIPLLLVFLFKGEKNIDERTYTKIYVARMLEETYKESRTLYQCNSDDDCVCGITEGGKKIFGNKNYVVKPASNCFEEKEMGFCDEEIDTCVVQTKYCCTERVKKNDKNCVKRPPHHTPYAPYLYTSGYLGESEKQEQDELSEILVSAGKRKRRGDTFFVLGDLNEAKKDYAKVIKNLNKAMEIYNECFEKNGETWITEYLFLLRENIQLYLRMEEENKARQLLDKAYGVFYQMKGYLENQTARHQKLYLDELKAKIEK